MAIVDYSFDTLMRKTYLYSTLIFSLLAVSLFAMPRLTVVAVVDGMTAEDLATLRPYWQQGGIRTLSEEAFQTTVAFPHLVYGGNETTATLITGVTPDRHGYTMDTYYLSRDRKTHAMLEDASLAMTDFSDRAIFDMWEAERVTGDPRNSTYLRSEI